MKKLKQQQMVSGGGMKIFTSNNQEELIMKNLNKTMVKTNHEGFKMIQSIFTIFILTLMINFTGCMIGDNTISVSANGQTTANANGNAKKQPIGNSIIDYKSYEGSEHSIIVDNNTEFDIVAFFGSPDQGHLLSGVPASKSNHGLAKTSVFSQSTDFVLNVVKAEDYLKYKNSPDELKKCVLTKCYAYWNSNSANNNYKISISEHIGGNCSIFLSNMSQWNIELRNSGLDGETIGYCGPYTLRTEFSVGEGEYYIFPVFRRYDDKLSEIVSAYARYTDGGVGQVGELVRKRFALDESCTSASLNATEWIKGIKFCNTASYINIYNGSTNAISFYNGATSSPLKTSTGKTLINPGSAMTYEVPMLPRGNGEYTDYVRASGYAVGSDDTSKVYITSGSSDNSVNFDYVGGKMYMVIVHGNDLVLTVDSGWQDTSTDVSF